MQPNAVGTKPCCVGTEAVSNIRKHSEVSLLAEQKTRGTTPVVGHSEYTRNDALAMLDHQLLNATNVLQRLRMIKSPDIQNLNEKVGAVDFEWKLKKNPKLFFFDVVVGFILKGCLHTFLSLANALPCHSHAITSKTAALLSCSYFQPFGSHCSQYKELFKHSLVSRGQQSNFGKINTNLLQE